MYRKHVIPLHVAVMCKDLAISIEVMRLESTRWYRTPTMGMSFRMTACGRILYIDEGTVVDGS